MKILNSDEIPKQLMIWLKDFKDKILKNITLTQVEKLAILRRQVDMEAQNIVRKVEREFEDYSEPNEVDELQDYLIPEDI